MQLIPESAGNLGPTVPPPVIPLAPLGGSKITIYTTGGSGHLAGDLFPCGIDESGRVLWSTNAQPEPPEEDWGGLPNDVWVSALTNGGAWDVRAYGEGGPVAGYWRSTGYFPRSPAMVGGSEPAPSSWTVQQSITGTIALVQTPAPPDELVPEFFPGSPAAPPQLIPESSAISPTDPGQPVPEFTPSAPAAPPQLVPESATINPTTPGQVVPESPYAVP